MATVTVKHHPSGGPADPLALVDGPTYDSDPHIVTGLENINNTSDANKPVSTAQAAAIAAAQAAAIAASQPLNANLTGLGALNSTGGLVVETAANTFTQRTLTGTANQIVVTNGDGVAGAPVISIPSSAALPGAPTTMTPTQWDGSTKIATTAYVDSLNAWNPGSLENLSITTSVAANALTITMQTQGGATPSPASPVIVSMGSATAATGTYTPLKTVASTSLVISSGSKVGAVNATAFALWIVQFSDGQLGAINCRGLTKIYPLSENIIASSTAEGGAGAAASAGVFYTTSAVSSKPYRILAKLEWPSGLTAAGTWDAGPTLIRLKTPGMKLPGDTIQSDGVVLNEGSTLTSTTHTNTTIDGIASTARLQVGMAVTGTFVAANTVITAITSNTAITVNNATTGSATNSLTYSWVTNNATTSFVDTALTVTGFTLTSATNSVSYSYSAGTVASAASIEALTALRRGGVQISPTFIGAFSTAGVAVASSGGSGGEFPGSVGPFTYTVGIKSSAATTVSANDNNGGGSLAIAEIVC